MRTKAFSIHSVLLIPILLLSSCNLFKTEKGTEPIVQIETEFGTIKMKLYNETPLHRDNFLKLAEEGFYDGVIFHRVINNFMIQGGDPSTKLNDSIKQDDAGYTIDAEIVPHLFHKKGVLAAARLGDAQNPLKKSSGSQFYIVQGKVFNLEDLEKQRVRKEQMLKTSITNKIIMDKADAMMDQGLNPDFTKLYTDLQDTISMELAKVIPYNFREEQILAYTTIGGTPHLDADYTVFGEVIEGIEVVEKIAAVETGPGDKPTKDIRMKVKVLKK